MTAQASTAACSKVCVVAPMPPPYGGMSLQAERLVSRLKGSGIPVEVIPTNPALPNILAWAGRVAGLRTLIREIQYLLQLARRTTHCEVLHHFSASGLYFFAHSAPLVVLGRLLKKRVILNYRGGKAGEFLTRWGWIVVPLMRLASQICVPSEFLQEIFLQHGLVATRLPNIAQVEQFSWRERARFAPRLLVTRHLEPMYNTECLLRAFRIVKERFSDTIFTIAGDGSESSRLRAVAAQWDLRGVEFLGAVPHAELPALYAAHDIYVNSSNVDNFPGALVEAACSGLPIVTTGAGGIPWMIRNGESGVVVALDDHEALAAGVIEVLGRPEFGRNLARCARSWAEQFSWSHVLPKLLACYGCYSAAGEVHLSEAEVLSR